MVNYFFSTEHAPNRDVYAEYDHVGDSICIYLPEFKDVHEAVYAFGSNWDDIIIALCCAVFSHEDLHREISQEVDTTGGQEHESVYDWIRNFMNKND